MKTLNSKSFALALSVALVPGFAMAEIAADIQHPLWYKEPSAKTMEIAAMDSIDGVVVSDGQRGEPGFPAAELKLTEEQIEKVKAGKFTVAISMGWLGDDWASQQLIGLKETFEKLGIEVVAETNANWDDAKQIADLEAISVLKPDLLVSIPLNGQTTASAYKAIEEAGTEVVFIDQAVDGMEPGEDYAAIISSDNLALGMYLADALAESLGGKGDVAAMYFANDFYVANLCYEGFIARVMARYPEINVVAAAGHNDPNKARKWRRASLPATRR